jgi:hypothetical protein
VSWSLGETRALVLKAARGAGMTWGLAEEAGEAVVWLQTHGLPGVSALCRYLSWYRVQKSLFPKWTGTLHEDNTIPYCPFIIGTAISDGAIKIPTSVNNNVSLGLIKQPLLLLPFVSASAPVGYGLYIGNISISVALGKKKLLSHLDFPNALLMDEAGCSIRPISHAISNFQLKAPPLRLPDCYGGCIKVFNMFAGKTYAPSTELSRSTGAGANLIDGD